MTNELILQGLKRSGMLYELEGFSIPNRIIQAVSGKCKLDIKFNREKNLRDNYASSRPTNKNFEPLMDVFNEKNRKRFNYIPEFPFYILDREKWFAICPSIKYTSNKKEHDIQDTNYFLADYFFPEYSVIIELDSAYHDTDFRIELDKARDEYLLSEYGIETFRVRGFGFKKGSPEVSMAMNKVKEYLLRLKKNPIKNKEKQVEVFRDNYMAEIYIIEEYIEPVMQNTTVIHLGTILKRIEDTEDKELAFEYRESIERILGIIYPTFKITKW